MTRHEELARLYDVIAATSPDEEQRKAARRSADLHRWMDANLGRNTRLFHAGRSVLV